VQRPYRRLRLVQIDSYQDRQRRRRRRLRLQGHNACLRPQHGPTLDENGFVELGTDKTRGAPTTNTTTGCHPSSWSLTKTKSGTSKLGASLAERGLHPNRAIWLQHLSDRFEHRAKWRAWPSVGDEVGSIQHPTIENTCNRSDFYIPLSE